MGFGNGVRKMIRGYTNKNLAKKNYDDEENKKVFFHKPPNKFKQSLLEDKGQKKIVKFLLTKNKKRGTRPRSSMKALQVDSNRHRQMKSPQGKKQRNLLTTIFVIHSNNHQQYKRLCMTYRTNYKKVFSSFLLFLFLILLNTAPNKQSLAKISNFPNLYVSNHPLIQQKLSTLRDKDTNIQDFRKTLEEIGLLLGYEATQYIKITPTTITTPLTKTTGWKKQEIVLVPILRAGLGMTYSLQKLLPDASVGFVGIARDHETLMPKEYLFKIPKVKKQLFIIVDPMIATANSSIHAITKLEQLGVTQENMVFMALIAAPEGIKALQTKFPKLKIVAAALDDHLNEKGYIVSGLGDAGDRIYGTE